MRWGRPVDRGETLVFRTPVRVRRTRAATLPNAISAFHDFKTSAFGRNIKHLQRSEQAEFLLCALLQILYCRCLVSSMQKDFLFVNRDKDTFGQYPRERRAIAVHAQKKYQRKLRTQQILARQSRTAARASLRAKVSGSSGPSNTSTPSTFSPKDQAGNANRDDQRLRRISVASPTSSLNEYGLSAVPLDKGAYETLQFFLNVSLVFFLSLASFNRLTFLSVSSLRLATLRCHSLL